MKHLDSRNWNRVLVQVGWLPDDLNSQSLGPNFLEKFFFIPFFSDLWFFLNVSFSFWSYTALLFSPHLGAKKENDMGSKPYTTKV